MNISNDIRYVNYNVAGIYKSVGEDEEKKI